jgi:hypothetical protein
MVVRPWCRGKDNIKLDLRCDGNVDLTYLCEDIDQWRDHLNMIMNCREGSTNCWEFLDHDRLHDLVVRAPGYRRRGPGFDYRRY